MNFSKFLGSLVLSPELNRRACPEFHRRIEGLLLCIKTKKLERIKKKIEENTFNDLVPEISGFHNNDNKF